MSPIYRLTENKDLKIFEVCEFTYTENRTKCIRYYYTDYAPKNAILVKNKNWNKSKEANRKLWLISDEGMQRITDLISFDSLEDEADLKYKIDKTLGFDYGKADSQSLYQAFCKTSDSIGIFGYTLNELLPSLPYLNKELRDAVKIEDYERAAELRDKINELQNEESKKEK